MEENTPAPPHCVLNAYHEEGEGARIRNAYEVRVRLTQLGIPFELVADIALYAYTHVAHEGDFDLTPFPIPARPPPDARRDDHCGLSLRVEITPAVQ